MNVVAISRLALEVMVGEINAAIEGAIRRLEQKDAATAFVSGRDVFISLPTSGSKPLYCVCLFIIHVRIPT